MPLAILYTYYYMLIMHFLLFCCSLCFPFFLSTFSPAKSQCQGCASLKRALLLAEKRANEHENLKQLVQYWSEDWNKKVMDLQERCRRKDDDDLKALQELRSKVLWLIYPNNCLVSLLSLRILQFILGKLALPITCCDEMIYQGIVTALREDGITCTYLKHHKKSHRNRRQLYICEARKQLEKWHAS